MHALGSQHLRRRATRHRGARCHLRLDVRHSGETLIAFALPLIALRAIALPADGCTQSEPWCRTRHLLRRRVRQPARSVARLPPGTRHKSLTKVGASAPRQFCNSSAPEATRPVGQVLAPPRKHQRPAVRAGINQVIGKRLWAAPSAPHAVPEFMPKQNSALVGTTAGLSKDAPRREIGELRVSCAHGRLASRWAKARPRDLRSGEDRR
jgi:hypothetical protein